MQTHWCRVIPLFLSGYRDRYTVLLSTPVQTVCDELVLRALLHTNRVSEGRLGSDLRAVIKQGKQGVAPVDKYSTVQQVCK